MVDVLQPPVINETELAPMASKLDGAMDGATHPKGKYEEFMMVIAPLKERYGHYIVQCRSWREFAIMSRPTKDTAQIRLTSNVPYFQTNYAALFLVTFLIDVMITPSSLLVTLILLVAWFFFAKKNEDPNWKVNVANMELGKTHRYLIALAVTAILLLVFLGGILFSVLGLVGTAVCVHGICHPSEEREEIQDSEQNVI